METNYNTPLYYSFSEFLARYDEDFNYWKTFYPDGTEQHFLEVLNDKYTSESAYFFNSKGTEFNNFVELQEFNKESDYPFTSEVHLRDFSYTIKKRLSHKKTEYPESFNFDSFDFDSFDSSIIAERYPTDNYYIDLNMFWNYAPFLEIKESKNILELSEHTVYFNEYKYKNFEYTVKQVLEYTEKRKIELQNAPNPTNEIKKLNWQGTQTELTELIKALIENGSIKGTQKDIFNSFSEFLTFQINNPSKLINDIKTNRNNGNETIFLDNLKTSLLNFITKENRR